MQDYIEKRVLEISSYIMESSATVRQTAAISVSVNLPFIQ